MIAVQGTLDELGDPLIATTFVVVDLETTGSSPGASEITEVGAVKVRGGEVLGEFQTLVSPGIPIPAFVAVLTGITDVMVAAAPRIDAVLPAFLEFSQGCVLVAHNAPFDIGFLKTACERLGHAWPRPGCSTPPGWPAVSSPATKPTTAGSRRWRASSASTMPTHRALDDARATVDVLHGLIERLGNVGVHTVDELATWQSMVTPAQRRKRYSPRACLMPWGVPLPRRPGRRPLRRQEQGHANAGPHILHRVGDAQPHDRDGRRRRDRHGYPVRHGSRPRCVNYASSRRANRATTADRGFPSGQPGSAHRRALPTALPGP